ncbi:PilN domain-containing protein [Neisseria sp. 83E34]|uniref:PilN domain-containing protein n=1 Tax=Neisseria sp. 83E34 TaxID=1692264 RepID=UPI0006CE8189|nr:PilN domain-containing protein [Neisseria sp. 83E34]KPN72323.1 pilus assembly protein PilP [Neisseria sp. 83E34]
MIELTRINLLPYREQIEQRQKQRFKTLMLLALAAGVGLSVVAYMGIGAAISKQEERNAFLTKEIEQEDKKLVEIKKLSQEKRNFLDRKQKIEELQHKRFQAAYIVDTLNVLIPEGTHLTSIKVGENPNTYLINGKATSDNKIAIFMRSIPSTGLFTQPELLSIKQVDKAQEFSLKVLLNQYSSPAQKNSNIDTEAKLENTGDVNNGQ